jgi:hypothetical protein
MQTTPITACSGEIPDELKVILLSFAMIVRLAWNLPVFGSRVMFMTD